MQVAGWVRNCPDGSVEAVLQGQEEPVNRMLDEIRKGPPMALVENVEVSRTKSVTMFPSFEIRR